MSPEAVEKPESVDGRSDLYSLGAVGYWLLTGKTLFDDDTVEDLLVCQVKESPPHPSERLGRPVVPRPRRPPHAMPRQAAGAASPQRRGAGTGVGGVCLGGSLDAMDAEQWWRANMAAVEACPRRRWRKKRWSSRRDRNANLLAVHGPNAGLATGGT